MAAEVSLSLRPAPDSIRNGLEPSGKLLPDFVMVDVPNHNDCFPIRRSPLGRKAKSASPGVVKKLFLTTELDHLKRSSGSSMATTTSSTSEASISDHCPTIVTSEPYLSQPLMVDVSPIVVRRGEKHRPHKPLAASSTLVPVNMGCDDVDSVFQDERARAKNEEEIERKLVDWAINVYVPSCKTLLQHCATKKVVPGNVQADLQHLSNTVTFFCNEHQERSGFNRCSLSPSKSIGEIPDAVSYESSSEHLSPDRTKQPDHPESDSTVAVKVLRSVSTSLLHPLLEEAARGFNYQLYKDIVSAIQKISWKVEACLTSVDENFSIHGAIFDHNQTSIVRTMMTALPPEEPKIHSSPAHIVRKGSVSGNRRAEVTYVPVVDHEPVIPSPLHSQLYSPDPVDRPKSANPRHSSSDEIVSEDMCCSVPTSPFHSDFVESNYFHPRSSRRQTISLSKRQVKSLGLNMIRSTEASELVAPRSNTIGMGSRLAIQREDSNVDLQEIRDKVRLKLAKEGLGHLEDNLSQDPPPDIDVSPCKESNCAVPERPATLTGISTNAHDATTPPPHDSLQTPSSPIYYRGHQSTSADDFSSRYSCDPVLMYDSSSTPRSTKKKSGLRYRAPSLDLDLALSTTNDAPKSPSAVSHHGSFSAASPLASTLPTKKRTLVNKLRKKASKSFGRGDTTLKRKGMKLRNSEFFSSEESRREGSVFQDTSTLESFSTSAMIASKPTKEACFLSIEVEIASKSSKATRSPGGKRKPSISAGSLSSATLELSVSTNMPELRQQEYKIVRTFKEVVALYDKMKQTCSSVSDFPDRPERKIMHKKERQQAEDFLCHVTKAPSLRMSTDFLQFMQPEGSTFSRQESEPMEHLMTFYTPTMYPYGVPGSHHVVEVVTKDLPTPTSPHRNIKYPSLSKKSSGKWSTRRDGNEEQSTFIIREEGHDVLMISEEEDKIIIVAGTFEKLVEQLACEERPDARYVSTLLLGYRHFSTSEELLSALIRRFQMTVAPDASEQEVAYAEKWRYIIQLRVLDVVGYWMKNCWADFHRNPRTLAKLKTFIETLKDTEDANFQTASATMKRTVDEKLAKFKRLGYPSPSRKGFSSQSTRTSPSSSASPTSPNCSLHSVSPVCTPSPSHIPVSNGLSPPPPSDIHSFSAIQLARQLTLIELEFLKVMDIYELAVYAWESSSPENKPYRRNLDAYIARFNTVSYWVASEICAVEEVKARAMLIEKFIDIAKHCLENRNFNTTVSVVTGLALSAVRRLKKTWEHVSEKMTKSFHKLQHLTYPSSNHSDYRKALAAASRRDGCIPYFGVFMRDVTLFNEGNSKRLKNGLINFSKLRTLVTMFEELKQFQRSPYYFPPEDRCMAFCNNLHCMTEQVLYETSELREPRELVPPEETT